MTPIPFASSLPQRLTRREAIEALRRHLMSLTDDQHSICQVASDHGIFCGGFRRFSDVEFRERFNALVARRDGLTRAQKEYLANTWQLARQILTNVSLACDAQTASHDSCGGWDDFSNEDLSRYLRELLAADVTVVPDLAPAPVG
jgi:hypothetical protein